MLRHSLYAGNYENVMHCHWGKWRERRHSVREKCFISIYSNVEMKNLEHPRRPWLNSHVDAPFAVAAPSAISAEPDKRKFPYNKAITFYINNKTLSFSLQRWDKSKIVMNTNFSCLSFSLIRRTSSSFSQKPPSQPSEAFFSFSRLKCHKNVRDNRFSRRARRNYELTLVIIIFNLMLIPSLRLC